MDVRLPLKARAYIAKDILFGNRQKSSSILMEMGGWSSSAVGKPSQMLKAYAHMPWLRAVFGKISDGVGSAPWLLEAAKKNGKYRSVKQWANARGDAREKIKKKVAASHEIEDIFEHPLLDLLAAPNSMMTGPSLMGLTGLYIDLVGEAIWWKETKGDRLVALWPIPPSWINERPKEDSPVFKLSADGFPKEISVNDVVWFRQPSPANPYTETASVAGPLADELEADEYASKHIKSFFLNSARPDILISGTGLSREEAERAEEKWLGKLRGYFKAHRPHFIGKDVTVTQLSNKFTDMQLVDLRKWQRDVVLQAAGMPPEILGVIETSNRATITAASYVFAKWVLTPRLELIRSTLQVQLVPLYDPRLVLDYFSPVEEDREFRIDTMKITPHAWTANEWRDVVGDRPLPDDQGEVVFIPNSYSVQKVSELSEFISPYTSPELLEVLDGKTIDGDGKAGAAQHGNWRSAMQR